MLVNSYRFASAGASSVTDSFNRADNASTMGNTDTGQTWVPNSGTWGISSNRAYESASAPGGQRTTVVDSGMSDCNVQVTFTTYDDTGLCFRSTDDNNHFLNNTSELFRKQSGGYTSLGYFSSTFGSGDVMKVELNGTSIKVYRNGSLVLSATSSFNQTATKHGLRKNGASTSRFDDFSVVPL